MISMRNYLSVSFGGTRLCSHFSNTDEAEQGPKVKHSRENCVSQ